MMRKRSLSLVCAVAIVLGLFCGCDFSASSPMTTEILSEEALSAIVEQREEAQNGVPSIAVNGVPAVYAKEEACFYWSVTADRKWEGMALSLSDDPDNAYTVAFTSDFTQTEKSAFLGKNRSASLIVYDDTSYWLCEMKFSSLPLLSVNTAQLPSTYRYADLTDPLDAEADAPAQDTEDADGEDTAYDPYAAPPQDPDQPIGEGNVFASLTVLDPLAEQHGYENGFTSMARVHLRGRSSRAYPKNSYKLELLKEDASSPGVLVERNKTLLGMRSDGDWILNGMYAEPTKLRDYVASHVWLQITADRETPSLCEGYHTEYAELFINGRYWGLYLLCERIDRKQMGLTDEDLMYFSEGDVGKSYQDFLQLPKEKMTRRGYSIKWPKQRDRSYDEWQSFSDFVYLIDNTDRKTFQQQAGATICYDSAADYWIFVQCTSAVDNLIQNTFYVARQQEDGSFLYSFVPWDMDQTFGNRWSGEEPLLTHEDYNTVDTIWTFWVTTKLLTANPDHFRLTLKERYATLRDGVLSDDALRDLLTEAQTKVHSSGAFVRNQQRWPEGGYQDDLTELRRYMLGRMTALDSTMDSF